MTNQDPQQDPEASSEASQTRYRIDREHPIGGEMSDILAGLFRRFQLKWLLAHYSRVPVLALFSFVNGCLSIGIMSLLAIVTHSPFIFPSLGPTAFLFFYTPTAPTASPRNALIGHGIGVVAGYFSLVVTGLTMAGPALRRWRHRVTGHRRRALAGADVGADGIAEGATPTGGRDDAHHITGYPDPSQPTHHPDVRRGAVDGSGVHH